MEPPHFTDLVLAAQCGEERRGGPTGETTAAAVAALQEVSVGAGAAMVALQGRQWRGGRGDCGGGGGPQGRMLHVWRSEGSDVMFKEAERKGEGR